MKILIALFWLIIFTKLFFFWVWLWQLKEYNWGRFKAHFETQKTRKLLSCLKYAKFPKPTKKTVTILISGILFELLILFYIFSLPEYLFYFSLLILIILSPVIFSLLILSFQIPTNIIIKRSIKKSAKKRKQFKNLLVIGVTGSYGKTSTKEFLATILSKRFNVLKTRAHINAKDGIAAVVLKELKPEHQIFIAEIGAYKRGTIKEVCQMLQPKIGIVTGVNEQHLALFGSMENLLSAEGGRELVESLPEDGVVFFNGKNKYCRDLYEKVKIKKFLYGENAPLLLENLEGAKMVAKELGMTDEEISRGAEKIKNKWPGIELKKGINGINIIDATYSANPDGVMTYLNYLKTLPGRKIIIMPCLIELGPASIGIHKKIGRKIAEVCDLAIITTRDRFEEIREGALLRPAFTGVASFAEMASATKSESAGYGGREIEKNNILFLENPKEIIEKIKSFCLSSEARGAKADGAGDTVLLEGRIPKEVIKELAATN